MDRDEANRQMQQMHGEDDLSDDIGCVISLIIDSICDCDEPSEGFVEVRRLRESRRKQGGGA